MTGAPPCGGKAATSAVGEPGMTLFRTPPQKTKRDLADAIRSADNSLIRDLSQEDLQLLLS